MSTLLVDTNFLIGRWRRRDGAEQAFIKAHPDDVLAMPWIVKAEFLRGAAVAGHDVGVVAAFLEEFPTLWPGETTLVVYARTWATLLRGGGVIGPHDLWIAACGLEHGHAVVTRNAKEFERVPELQVVRY